jgi:hypothetical protein
MDLRSAGGGDNSQLEKRPAPQHDIGIPKPPPPPPRPPQPQPGMLHVLPALGPEVLGPYFSGRYGIACVPFRLNRALPAITGRPPAERSRLGA